MESIACVKEDEKMKFALEGIKVIDFQNGCRVNIAV